MASCRSVFRSCLGLSIQDKNEINIPLLLNIPNCNILKIPVVKFKKKSCDTLFRKFSKCPKKLRYHKNTFFWKKTQSLSILLCFYTIILFQILNIQPWIIRNFIKLFIVHALPHCVRYALVEKCLIRIICRRQ